MSHRGGEEYVSNIFREDPDLPVCDSKLSITYNSPNKTQQITKDVPCFTKPVPPPTMMPTYPPAGGSGDQDTPTAAPSGLDSGSSFPLTSAPSDVGSGSSMPWPTSYPHYLTTVNYQDMFTETENVLIWGGSDRYDHDHSSQSLSTTIPGTGLLAA